MMKPITPAPKKFQKLTADQEKKHIDLGQTILAEVISVSADYDFVASRASF